MHCIDKISTLIIASRPRLKDVKFDQKLNAITSIPGKIMASARNLFAQPVALAYA